MKKFVDTTGRGWTAYVREETTPRHHGRFYLAFRSDDGTTELEMPEVRWQNQASANRILRTMGDIEAKRRLQNVLARHASNDGASAYDGVIPDRERTNVSAG